MDKYEKWNNTTYEAYLENFLTKDFGSDSWII